jgi:CBS domain containing-hemolysin-like protein
MMEWLFDPNIWVGLLTLVVLEIVLGIDNLIFIAILAEKVPPHQRDKARLIGLSLAMIMRLGLLTMISWMVTLTAPLFDVMGKAISGRDLILLLGGVFLLFKATMELHERVEGKAHVHSGPRVYASLGAVIAQIIVLDAVFSLDAVITAVGMVDELGVMMAAVVISMGVMIFASKPLTRFVNAHPTVVVLCLSFLLMIGLSLVAEGLGFHIPKGYLYAAIGFSIVIEFFNQLVQKNFLQRDAHVPLRARTAGAVLRLLGSRTRAETREEADNLETVPDTPAFDTAERNMVSGVLSLAQRPVRSIMTVRADVTWVDLDASADAIRQHVLATPHSLFPVCRDQLNEVVGVVRGRDLIADLILQGKIDMAHVRPALIMPEAAGVMRIMETLKRAHGQLVLIADEYGTIQGLVTPIDLLEAIAGEFPDEDEQPAVRALGGDRWQVDGTADLIDLQQVLQTDALVSPDAGYTSLGGFLLARFDRLPAPGDTLAVDGLQFEVATLRERGIDTVLVTRMAAVAAQEDAPAASGR